MAYSTAPAPTTKLSLRLLRLDGYMAEVVEKWHGSTKHDLYGFADILAVRPKQPRVLLVQTTTASHISDHRSKLCVLSSVGACLAAGCAVHLHGWDKKSYPGGRRQFWQVQIYSVEFTTLNSRSKYVYGAMPDLTLRRVDDTVVPA